jgi:phenylpropionate dioxygenase-like ring-hydroxylating dioxygenase large terminal subunit
LAAAVAGDRTCLGRSFDIDDYGFTARFKAQQGRVFMEDVEILEAQQRSIGANPERKLRAYSIDEGAVRARRIIGRLSAAQEQGTS